MPERSEDARSKKVIFVSNCLLNASNKVQEFARYPGMFSEVLRTLDKYGLGVLQMPCPETLYMGNQRWWHARNLYDNAGFRRFCRQLASQMADYMENYHIMGYESVAILVCDGSPTCGYTLSSHYDNGGGRPTEVIRSFEQRPGVYTEELIKEVQERGIPMPQIYGLPMDDREKTNEQIIAEFDRFIADKLGKTGEKQ
jgi:predicted secreted protein